MPISNQYFYTKCGMKCPNNTSSQVKWGQGGGKYQSEMANNKW